MHLPEDTLGLVGGRSHPRAVGDVDPDRVDLPAPQRRHRLVQVLLPDIREHDLHPGPGERPGHAEADPARAPGDERDLALDVLHRPQRHASTETVGPGMLRNFARIGEPMKMLKWPFVWPPATTTLIRFVSKIGISSSGGAFR